MRISDYVGKKFGRLTVIDKNLVGRSKSNCALYILECDCGEIVERTSQGFTRSKTPSCGCYKREILHEISAARRKPDPTGQRFHRLVVLGKGERLPHKNSFRQMWKCSCDCGKIVQIDRQDIGKQKSCGCIKAEYPGPKKLKDLTGRRFDSLTVDKLTGKKRHRKPLWLLRCDCGNYREMSWSEINNSLGRYRLNCGDRTQHPEKWLHYPITPSPLPEEVCDLLEKYLHLTELPYTRVDSAVEDERRDRLIRCAWIIVYRQQQGEHISGAHQRRLILKYMQYSSLAVKRTRALERHGHFPYNRENASEIGSTMTNITSENYPVIETRGKSMLPKSAKRFKFRRC